MSELTKAEAEIVRIESAMSTITQRRERMIERLAELDAAMSSSSGGADKQATLNIEARQLTRYLREPDTESARLAQQRADAIEKVKHLQRAANDLTRTIGEWRRKLERADATVAESQAVLSRLMDQRQGIADEVARLQQQRSGLVGEGKPEFVEMK